MKSVLPILLIGCISCGGAQFTHKEADNIGEELDFITSGLRQEYGATFANDSCVLVYGLFSCELFTLHVGARAEWEAEMLAAASDTLPLELLQDFIAKNASPQEVWSELQSRLNLIIISKGALDTVWSDNPWVRSNQLIERYPKSRGAIQYLSRVGFNKDRSLALWFRGGEMGGLVYIYRKVGPEWVRSPSLFGWSE